VERSSEDYHAYNKICGQVRRLSHLLSRLPPADPFRQKYQDLLLSKLYDMGILDRGAKMSDIEGSDAPVVKGFKGKEKEVEGQAKREGKITVGAMCRRRLAVVLVRLKMAETVKMVRLSFLSHALKPT
jgi:U3 small nucleolar ribonucleoprotein protein IMP3